jgi:hypothetical protein
MGIRTGTGGKGRSFNDRELAGKVRTLGLKEMFKVLSEEETEDNKAFKQALLLRMATNLLPRLQEITGKDGEALQITGVEINVRRQA